MGDEMMTGSEDKINRTPEVIKVIQASQPECNICMYARVQSLPVGLRARFTFWPECIFCINARKQKMHVGRGAKFAFWRK
jgi:hypothetical protein